jgi:hypothetical protein
MAGTYIPIGQGSTPAFTLIIDEYITPRLMSFRQITINDDQCTLSPDDNLTWSTTYGNILSAAPFRVRKMGQLIPTSQVTDMNWEKGTFKAGTVSIGGDKAPLEEVLCSYWFDYFPTPIIESFLKVAMQIVNTAAYGPTTTYTIDTAPTEWYGVLTDMAFAQCMEKLLLDYDLWRYRLLFAIGPNEVEGGGGDVVSQIETLKQNAESRAARTLENEKFKCGNVLAAPTRVYYDAVRGIGGGRGGYPVIGGRLRGWRPTRLI